MLIFTAEGKYIYSRYRFVPIQSGKHDAMQYITTHRNMTPSCCVPWFVCVPLLYLIRYMIAPYYLLFVYYGVLFVITVPYSLIPENPELRVYVEDALRLVLAARPEKPLDLIDNYFQRYVDVIVVR